MKALTHATFLGIDGPFACFDLGFGFDMRVAILEKDIARISLRHKGAYRLDRTWSIAPNRSEPPFGGRKRDDLTGFSLPAMEVKANDQTISLTSDGISARIRLHPFAIDWFRAGESEPFLSDRKTQAYFASRKNHGFKHYLARTTTDRHYGLGDKSGAFDKTGRRLRIDAVDPCGFDAETSDPLYKMLPFYIVDGESGVHGVYYDMMATAEVDFGATIDNYHGLFRSFEGHDGDLDCYVFAGPTLPHVVKRFSWLTGGQAFPPLWSLGFGMTSMALADAKDADAQIADFAATCHTFAIPCKSFHFGSGYSMHEGRRYAFRWNKAKFPDPAATMRRLNDAGMQTVANLKPCLLEDHPRLGELTHNGLVQDAAGGTPALAQFWDGMGYHIDFTNPKARAWWRQGIEETLLSTGLATIWNDNNEYEIWDEDAVCAGEGQPFAQSLARPLQALLMTKLSYEAQRAKLPHKRPYAISRAGCAGIARYGQTWSGDNATAWKSLRYNLAQGLTMSMSGLYNIGHDVGGFHGPAPDAELLTRFSEFCCLWPRFVMNSWNDDGTTTTPWMHKQALPAIRAAMQLRELLMPMLYTLMWQAATHDEPVIRPLVHDFATDPIAAPLDDCFMLGADILVAPVLEQGATLRRLYLPHHDGGWYDFHSGHHHAGGEWVETGADHLPLFVRAGAMLLLQDDGLCLNAYGNPNGTAVFYWADDDRMDWRGNDEGMLSVTCQKQEDGSLRITTSSTRAEHKIVRSRLFV